MTSLLIIGVSLAVVVLNPESWLGGIFFVLCGVLGILVARRKEQGGR